ncbi:MAG TPA: hypothetical protein VH817_02810 [Thermoleophilaceae bacterium]
MRTRRKPAQELRNAIDCLPERTRAAMLEGLNDNQIIVGAYTDPRGGVCPMLAAHRHGGRTSFATFAKAWDRYTRAGPRARPASERELRALRSMLEASLAELPGGDSTLGEEVSRVKAARRASAERAARGAGQGLVSQLLRRDRVPQAEQAQEPERELV